MNRSTSTSLQRLWEFPLQHRVRLDTLRQNGPDDAARREASFKTNTKPSSFPTFSKSPTSSTCSFTHLPPPKNFLMAAEGGRGGPAAAALAAGTGAVADETARRRTGRWENWRALTRKPRLLPRVSYVDRPAASPGWNSSKLRTRTDVKGAVDKCAAFLSGGKTKLKLCGEDLADPTIKGY